MSPFRIWASLLLPIGIAYVGYRKKSLDISGVVTGLIVGFVLTLGNFCFFASLFAFFVSGSLVTKIGGKKKKSFEHDFKEGGQRNWLQVLSNGGASLLAASIYLIEAGMAQDLPIDFSLRPIPSLLAIAVLTSLAGACGDTWSSEVGSVLSTGNPRLITTGKRVPRGTNGAVSLVGSCASLVGGALVGVAYYVALVLTTSRPLLYEAPDQWVVIPIAALAGLVASFVDSCLGATLQYSGQHNLTGLIVNQPGRGVRHISGVNLLDNHNVNLVTSFIVALLLPSLVFYTWPYIQYFHLSSST